jgi:hypothetical protein
LHVGQLPGEEMMEVLEAQAAHATSVVTHLLDIERLSPIRSQQVYEVMIILLKSPKWQSAVRSSPALVQRTRHHETSEQLQALFTTSLQTRGKPAGPFWEKAKQLFKRWILGCGQKSGEGVSSPSSKSRTASASTLAASGPSRSHWSKRSPRPSPGRGGA